MACRGRGERGAASEGRGAKTEDIGQRREDIGGGQRGARREEKRGGWRARPGEEHELISRRHDIIVVKHHPDVSLHLQAANLRQEERCHSPRHQPALHLEHLDTLGSSGSTRHTAPRAGGTGDRVAGALHGAADARHPDGCSVVRLFYGLLRLLAACMLPRGRRERRGGRCAAHARASPNGGWVPVPLPLRTCACLPERRRGHVPDASLVVARVKYLELDEGGVLLHVRDSQRDL